MIDNALNVLVSELNNFFRIKYQLSEDIIILSNIVNSSGENTYKDENKLIVSLINIEEEKIIQKANGNHKNAPLYINIYILISTSFNEKLINEALKFLSSVIAFFQSKRKFTNTNTASLSSNIDKLLVDIDNITNIIKTEKKINCKKSAKLIIKIYGLAKNILTKCKIGELNFAIKFLQYNL